jgi:DNA-binding transcriptional LysR family regulator
MRELYRRLPSLTALVAFEAASRHGSFSRAAEELYVSQAAVSRQIKALEAQLDTRLFERLHRSVALTAAGEELHRAVGYGFDQIADAVTRLQRLREDRPVGIAANNAVAFYWLQPRATAFQRRHPEVELAVFASDTDLPLEGEDIDIAVRYGDGHWPDAEARLLFEEEVFPVCSPAYLAAAGPLERPACLLDHTLLYMYVHGPEWVTWAQWLRAHDVTPTGRLPSGLTFDSYPVLLQAAIEGQGIAIGTRHLLDRPMRDGTLVRPLKESYRTGRGYYLALPVGQTHRPWTLRFRDWLLKDLLG